MVALHVLGGPLESFSDSLSTSGVSTLVDDFGGKERSIDYPSEGS